MIEIFGPPGSGKTSVARALAATSDRVRVVSAYRSRRNAVGYVRAAIELVRVLPARPTATRPARQVNWMIRLQASPRIAAANRRDGSVVAFDQGPLYTLVRLRGEGPAREDWRGSYRGWWDAAVRRWAEELDLGVLLEAPTEMLIGRIEGRAKPHEAKDNLDATRLIEQNREAHASVADELASAGLTLLRLDTATASIGDLAARVSEAVGLARLGGDPSRGDRTGP